jgi:hypothetical protein
MIETCFVTIFDSKYVTRAKVMVESLNVVMPNAFTFGALVDKDQKSERYDWLTSVFGIEELLVEFPKLSEAKKSRSRSEFIFTITPFVIDYVRRKYSAKEVVYLDADMFFFSSPKDYLMPLSASYAATIVPHNHLARNASLYRYGYFNVGWVGFNFTAGGLDILDFWKNSCINWCRDVVEDGKFADQGYLDSFSQIRSNVRIPQDNRLNLGPWSKSLKEIRRQGAHLVVNNGRLVCYHFQGFQLIGVLAFPNLLRYKRFLNRNLKVHLYKPYAQRLFKANLSHKINFNIIRGKARKLGTLKDRIRLLFQLLILQSFFVRASKSGEQK